MKVIYEFNLAALDSNDEDKYNCFKQSTNMFSALEQIRSMLRALERNGCYDSIKVKESEYKIIEDIREKFYDIINENNVELDL